MHEVGHSLGLRHNFRASTMLSLEDLNNTDLTRSKGMVGSVMDYNPLNVARKGQKQGDYATTTIGPYDYWAIEYGYSPIQGDEQAELKRIASRSPESDLAYGTDEDLSL
ncbi:MAG: zinc-dependent metalloprotease, partial [bacterium]